MKKMFANIIVLLSCFSLVSCVTSNILMVASATDEDAHLIDSGSGVLLVQIADTTPVGASYPINQITLAPKDVNVDDESKFPRLEAAEAAGESSNFFHTVLPSGEYSLGSLRAYYQFGESYLSRFYPAGIGLGTFSIEQGKVTDLGVIAVYIRRDGDDYRYKTVRALATARTADLFSESLPELVARMSNMDAPLQWHPDGNDSDRRGDYVGAVNRQITFADPFVDDVSGVIRFPSRLGVIVQRNDEGKWSLDSIPDDVELRQVTRVSSHDVVVTEFDEIYGRAPGDDNWALLPSPSSRGKLMFVGERTGSGIYAVMQEADSVTIWSAASLGESWNILGSISPELSFFQALDRSFFTIDHRIEGAGYSIIGNYLFMALRKDLYRFDFRNSTFEELEVSNAASVQIRNGVITVRAPGSSTSNRVSFDSGNTWQRSAGKFIDRRFTSDEQRPRTYRRTELFSAKFLNHPIFIDDQNGFALHEGKKSDDAPFLISTSDGSRTWTAKPQADLPEGCGQLVLANDKILLLACFLSGEVFRSEDAGESWVLDRAPSES